MLCFCYVISLYVVNSCANYCIVFGCLVPPSESEHSSTACKAHVNNNNKKEKSTVKGGSLGSSHKTVPPVSIKGHAPKHKGASASIASSQQAGSSTKQQSAPKPLDFKQLMRIASENKNGNRSKELVHKVLSSAKKATVPSVHEKKPTPVGPKLKQIEQACTKQPKTAAKQSSIDVKGLPNSRSIATALPQQKAPSGATSKQVSRTGNKPDAKLNPKPASVKLKTGSFYQSSAIGSEWSDMKKTIRKPQMQHSRNNFNISGSWINELGLNRLPTAPDSDYEDDDDLSDFVASDDEGIDDGDMEDYSAAIRDIFGYDKRRWVDLKVLTEHLI